MRRTDIQIAPGFTLDPDYVGGRTLALLAKRGAGKSYTARVLAEEFWGARIPFVLMDPMGTSWGLRSSADGEGEGIPVAIFGGEHGDAPLEPGGGALLADLVVDEHLSMVLDMSGLGTRAAERRFALDFLDRLYRRNRELVHLLIDEADLFAPQKPQAGDRPLLGVTENIIRRGRNRSIGATLISQRPAVLNKDVLTQVDGLVVMRIVGLTDREAVDRWVAGHGENEEQAHRVKASLAGLATGESWWWIPELGILERVQVRKTRTFDSSPTGQRGGKVTEPKSFADVDMGAIETRMAATIERAKKDDPRELKKKIAALEAELAKKPVEATVYEEVRVEVAPPDLKRNLKTAAAELARQASGAQALATRLAKEADELPDEEGKPSRTKTHAPYRQPADDRGEPPPPPPPPSTVERSSVNGDIPPARQRILDALASLQAIGVEWAERTQLALFAKTSPKSSGYANNLGALRSAELITYAPGKRVGLTLEGRRLARAEGAPTTTAELHGYLEELLSPARWRIVQALIVAWPEAVDREELAIAADTSPNSSGYANNLGALRSLGLLDYPDRGLVVANPVLFLE